MGRIQEAPAKEMLCMVEMIVMTQTHHDVEVRYVQRCRLMIESGSRCRRRRLKIGEDRGSFCRRENCDGSPGRDRKKTRDFARGRIEKHTGNLKWRGGQQFQQGSQSNIIVVITLGHRNYIRIPRDNECAQ